MSDMFRKILSRLFGKRFVVLVDHDGERNVRMVKWHAGKPYAWRFWRVRRAYLEDNGGILGPTYVSGWEPYDPSAALTLPQPRETVVPSTNTEQ